MPLNPRGVTSIKLNDGEAGFAQILVLAALAAIAAILTVAISTARLGGQQISALDARVSADTQLASGLAVLLDALDDSANDLEIRALARPVTAEFADRPLELSLVGEGGKIDVLRVDLSLIDRFATNAGLARGDVVRLLEELAARRGSGDDIGAMDALRLFLAEAIGFEAVDDNFTRFGSDKIDPAFATDAVLHAIPDLSSSQIMQIVAAPQAERAQYAALSRYFATGSRRFMLIARFDEGPDQRFERRLPIELTTSGGIIELDRVR